MAAGYGGLFRGESMIKRAILALAMMAAATVAHAAGTVPGFSLTPQFDLNGKVMPGCKLYVIQAGTVATPQNAYQDSGLSVLISNPILCDASGRLPQWFVADGLIKIRLTSSAGGQAFVGDSILVIGPSSGGGGGGTVDPTTVSGTGDTKWSYGAGQLTGWVRMNGRTVGSATSGATERANADTQALFLYLWATDPNLAVSGGRGLTASADWLANKTIVLPDARGRTFAAMDTIGGTDSARLATSSMNTCRNSLGCAGGEGIHLLTAQEAPIMSGLTAGGSSTATFFINNFTSTNGGGSSFQATNGTQFNTTAGSFQIQMPVSLPNESVSVNSIGGAAHNVVQPTILMTPYIKL
jgi:hypothetical protein